jgi:GntR family transcriptional regulator/MocR family aminotransferase
MLPYPTLIVLDRQAAAPLSQQLSAAFIRLIKLGLLPAGTRLPGTRTLASQLGLHRQTVVVAFDELAAQGWVELRPSSGAFVAAHIPEVVPQALPGPRRQLASRTGFTFERMPAGQRLAAPLMLPLAFDGGLPDGRLAPLAALARNYRAASRSPLGRGLLGYTDANGSLRLRQQLARYLQESRGVPAEAAHIFTTRGSIMALFLLAQVLLRPGDAVVVGRRSYQAADRLFEQRGARLLRVEVDEQGLCVDEVARLCQQQRVRLLYITPHHHYPTTVTLSAQRRVQLLQLAGQHDFIILEDDYDYDFHYAGSPILPLASADGQGRVLYVGSLSKTLAPAFRIGYIVAPPDLVEELGQHRRLIDQQGDTLLEQAVADLFAEGELLRHLKRARKVYHERRDQCCELLATQLSPWFSFAVPNGGMAVWGHFAAGISLPDLSECCRHAGLGLSDGRPFRLPDDQEAYLRLGFASLTPAELARGVSILQQQLRQQYS